MIEQLTSPSNYSVNEDALRLNSSSMISPSQSNIDSGFKKQLVEFQQFNQEENNVKVPCKKKLTIRIDESYEFKDANEGKQWNTLGFQKSNEKFHESVTTPMSDFNLISPIENNNNNIRKYYQDMQLLESRLEQKEAVVLQLTAELSSKNSHIVSINIQNQQLLRKLKYAQQELRGRDAEMKEQSQLMEKYEARLEQAEQRKRQKDAKIKEMIKINEKLKNLNKDLIYEIKTNEKKVRDLQKEIQKNMCLVTQENINKLKQSSLKLKDHHHTYSNSHYTQNKQNTVSNGGRKSLQRKKPATGLWSSGQLGHHKKATKVSSSTSNILTKKLMQK